MVKYNKHIINLTTQQLFKARLHLGHKNNTLNIKMLPYLFGSRHGISIFNLEKILICLRITFKAISEIVKQRGYFFLIGTNSNLPMVELFYYFFFKHSKLNINEKNFFITGFVGSKWVGGNFTNWKGTFQFIDHMNKSNKKNSTRYKKYLINLRGLGKIKNKPIPDFVFLFNNDSLALNEINKLNIPVIGITDSNTNPSNYLYQLPGNDDSLESMQFFCNFLEKAIEEGQFKDQERFFLFCFKKLKLYINK